METSPSTRDISSLGSRDDLTLDPVGGVGGGRSPTRKFSFSCSLGSRENLTLYSAYGRVVEYFLRATDHLTLNSAGDVSGGIFWVH